MKILFMGTSEFAVPSLEKLVPAGFDLIGVVTQPDRPGGRGKQLTPPPVKIVAAEHNIPIYQPEKVRHRNFVHVLRALQPDAIVVAAFGQILPKLVLTLPPCGCLNVHPSFLPKYRGAAPIQWALINGETETGITIMLLDEGEDTGDIVLQKRVPINNQDNAAALSDRLANLAPSLLIQALAHASEGLPPHQPQNHAKATHAPRLTKEIGQIDWEQPADRIGNLVRGTSIWPGAYTWVGTSPTSMPNDLRLKIIACADVDYPHPADVPSGTIQITSSRELIVLCGKGSLRLDRVQPANKKAMDARAFLNGYRLKTGDWLFRRKTPTH